MANKTPTLTEPVADDILSITIRCDGAGAVTILTGDVAVASSDASTHHEGNFNFDVSTLPAAAQTAVDNLIAECLIKFKAQHGF